LSWVWEFIESYAKNAAISVADATPLAARAISVIFLPKLSGARNRI